MISIIEIPKEEGDSGRWRGLGSRKIGDYIHTFIKALDFWLTNLLSPIAL